MWNVELQLQVKHILMDCLGQLKKGCNLLYLIPRKYQINFINQGKQIVFRYIKTLEWILIYSTVPVTFHIITNKDSIKYVNTIIEMVNKTSNCDFNTNIVTLADIIDKVNRFEEFLNITD